jgi:hypothetical protein
MCIAAGADGVQEEQQQPLKQEEEEVREGGNTAT